MATRALAARNITHAGGCVAGRTGCSTWDIEPRGAIGDVGESRVEGTALREADLANATGRVGDAIGWGRSADASVAGEAIAAVSCRAAAGRAPGALAVGTTLGVAAIQGCLTCSWSIEANVILAALALAAFTVEDAQWRRVSADARNAQHPVATVLCAGAMIRVVDANVVAAQLAVPTVFIT